MRLDAIAALEATINLRGSMTLLSPRAQRNGVTDERNRKCTPHVEKCDLLVTCMITIECSRIDEVITATSVEWCEAC